MTFVKISGITSAEDAQAAVDAGADFIGLLADEHSLRGVRPSEFVAIVQDVPTRIGRVLIFDRIPHPDWMFAGPDVLALASHIEYFDDRVWPDVVRENWPMEKKIKAFHIGSDKDLRSVANFNGAAQHFLLNLHARAKGPFSDSDAFGWELAREARQYGKRLFLSGGLTEANVAQAVRRVLPFAVDVSVGVEQSPGVKDRAKMQAFVQAVRLADGGFRPHVLSGQPA